MVGQVKVETYPADTRLCTQGANEDTFYIIAKGEVDVIIQTEETRKKVATKSAGDFWGEMVLILDAPRSADVITTSPSIMLELDRRSFKRATRISDQLANLLSERTMEQLVANRRQTQEMPLVQLPPYRIFTSYPRQNQEFVRKLIADLHASLTTSSVRLWLDQVDIPIGQKWDRAVEEALETCDAMLLVLSSASNDSENVRDEWMYYKENEKPIIPVLYEKCKSRSSSAASSMSILSSNPTPAHLLRFTCACWNWQTARKINSRHVGAMLASPNAKAPVCRTISGCVYPLWATYS